MSEIFDDKIKESFEKKGIADRNLARVLVSFPVQFLLLSEEEFESLCKIYVSTPTKDRLEKSGGAPHPQLDVSGTMAAAIFDRLDRIEEKMELLLVAGGIETEKSKIPAMEIAQALDLSGSGIRVLSRVAMSKGWYLKLSFDIPGPQSFNIVTLGRVVRSGSQNKEGYFDFACKFESMCEEDQDRVIAYVFRRQRELAHGSGAENQPESG